MNRFFDDYIETKYELKPSTRTNYKYMYNKYVREEIGYKDIASIKFSDIKKFYIHLIKDIGFKPNSMEIINTIIHPVFTIAMRDGLIRINPADGAMAEIKRSHNWEKPKRHALTEAQQSAFIEYNQGQQDVQALAPALYCSARHRMSSWRNHRIAVARLRLPRKDNHH